MGVINVSCDSRIPSVSPCFRKKSVYWRTPEIVFVRVFWSVAGAASRARNRLKGTISLPCESLTVPSV